MPRLSSTDAVIALREAMARLDAATTFLEGSTFTLSEQLVEARLTTAAASKALYALLREEERKHETGSTPDTLRRKRSANHRSRRGS